MLEASAKLCRKQLCCGVQREAANGSSEPHRRSSKHKHHKEHKQKRQSRAQEPPEGPSPGQTEPQGTPWLAEHILVKIIDKRLQGGRCSPPLASSSRGLTGHRHRHVGLIRPGEHNAGAGAGSSG